MAATCLYVNLHAGRAPGLLAGGLGLLMGGLATLVASCVLLQGAADQPQQGLGMQEVSGACLGAMLGTGAGMLWPAAHKVRLRPARAGALLGALGAGSCYLLLQALCWTSRHCLTR